MPSPKTPAGAASSSIYYSIGKVEAALKMKFPRVHPPSQSREIMITMLVATLNDATERGGQVGWGSPVRSEAEDVIRTPVWVEWVPGEGTDGNGMMTMTPGYEKMLDEVAKHLRKGKNLVVLGEKGWSDDYIRWTLMTRDKTYRKQNPAYRRKSRWNVQPPAKWRVFYVLGTDDIEDPYTMGRVARALKSGKRIIDISKIKPRDLTQVYQSAVDKRRR